MMNLDDIYKSRKIKFLSLEIFKSFSNLFGNLLNISYKFIHKILPKELANKSVNKISAESNGIYRLVPVKVLSAKSQVVAGILYHLEILVGQSKCTKTV